MSREREAEIIETLESYKGQPTLSLVTELLVLRRSRHRDKLENDLNPINGGRSKECKDLLQILS